MNGWTPERRVRQAELIGNWKPWKRSTGPRTRGKVRPRLAATLTRAEAAHYYGHWRRPCGSSTLNDVSALWQSPPTLRQVFLAVS